VTTSDPRPETCDACPVGALLGGLAGVQPEAREHLLTAAHELVQAARALLDAADAVIEQQRHARPASPAPRIRRIDIR
jgi:hypothetical protein